MTGPYSEDRWQAWVDEAAAGAVPGAIEFTKYARSRGVAVFYVTNRSAAQKQITRANLERLGFPLDPKIDTLYCKLDKPDWGSDKSSRRAEIAGRYRILMLFGDDLGDFTTGAADTVEKRRALAARYADRWGSKWIVLPNPMYGSWTSAIMASIPSPTAKQAHDLQVEALRKIAGQPAAQPAGKR